MQKSYYYTNFAYYTYKAPYNKSLQQTRKLAIVRHKEAGAQYTYMYWGCADY